MKKTIFTGAKACPYCTNEFADDVELAYHLSEDHRDSVLNGSQDGLEQVILDVVYFVVEADDAELARLVVD
jgi:hypothetical protein